MSGEVSEERSNLQLDRDRFEKKTAWIVETNHGYGALVDPAWKPGWKKPSEMAVFEDKRDALKAAKDYSDRAKKEGFTDWSVGPMEEDMKAGEFWVKIEKAVILSGK